MTRCMVVVGALVRGGAERQAVLAAHALSAVGAGTKLFVCRPPLHQLDDARALGVEVDLPRPGEGLGAQIGRLRGALRALDPDGVVTFLPGAGARFALATRGASRPRPRWIHSVRGNQTGADWRSSPLQSLLREACLHGADRVVANSAALAANTIATAPYTARKLEVIPNVLMPEEVDRDAAQRRLASIVGPADGSPLIGAIGSVREERNYELLALAFARIRREHPRARLVIVGRFGTPDCLAPAARLRARCAALGIQEAVTLAGEIPRARQLASAFDVVVVSSKLEGSSNALAEAIVAGAAVAATPVGDATELVGEGGVVAGGFTPTALATAISRVLADLPASRAAAARRRAQLLAEHSPLGVGRRWVEMLDPTGPG